MKPLFSLLIGLAVSFGLVLVAPSATALSVDKLVVYKAKRTMLAFYKNKAVKSYRISLGGDPIGHKQQEGDSRTPEGRYTIDAKNPNSSFHKSLRISYPNRQDLNSARSKGVSAGSAIMIHGTPEFLALVQATGTISDWTAGCIALTNSEIDELYASIRIGTPITIYP